MRKNLICVLLVAISSLGYATDDNQEFRANTSFSFKLNDSWKMSIAQEFHFRDGEHFEHENIVSFKYKAADWLDLGLGFKQLHKENSSHEWLRENRPYGEATVKKTLLGLKWSDRSRLAFRDNENSKDVFRFRNRLKAHVPHNLFDLPLQPYVADEIFIQEESGLYRNRIYAGLVWDVSDTLDIDIFMFHEKNETTHGRDDRYFFGFETKFSF